MRGFIAAALVPAAAAAAIIAVPSVARAEPPTTPLGARGVLAIDQISGVRFSADPGLGLTYYGPIGFSTRSITIRAFDTMDTIDTTYHFTTIWLAPSADYFVIDHLSVGGLVEIASTSGSVEVVRNGVNQGSVSTPSATDIEILPRVGWMFDISDRFGIWPRGGIGFISHQVPTIGNRNAQITDTYSGLVLDIDCGFLFRFTDSFFVKAAPDVAFIPGGSHSQTTNGVSVSANANAFQFGLIAGFGGFIAL